MTLTGVVERAPASVRKPGSLGSTNFGGTCDSPVSSLSSSNAAPGAPGDITATPPELPRGTAFISDVGMTGDYDSVIGMNKEEPVNRFLRRIPSGRFEPALGPATLCAVAAETDDATGLARHVGAVRLGGRLEQARPAFW